MDYLAEQEQELEVLESIYPDELRIISRSYPSVHFEVSVRLEPQLEDPSSLTREHTICVGFRLPEEYPEVAPVIELKAEEEGQSEEEEDEEEEPEFDDHGNRVVGRLQSMPDQIHLEGFMPELQVQLEEQIESDMLLGMQMCFALISSVKELCETWFVDQLGVLERQHELELQAREKEEQKKFRGTKVTRESYLAWRQKFRKELGIDQRDDKRRTDAHHGKMTGREIFERGLAGDMDDEAEEPDASLAEALKKTVI